MAEDVPGASLKIPSGVTLTYIEAQTWPAVLAAILVLKLCEQCVFLTVF